MKTLQECKDEVAINKGFKNWSSVDWYQINEMMQITTPPYAEEKLFLQASELFESQYREEIQRKDEEIERLTDLSDGYRDNQFHLNATVMQHLTKISELQSELLKAKQIIKNLVEFGLWTMGDTTVFEAEKFLKTSAPIETLSNEVKPVEQTTEWNGLECGKCNCVEIAEIKNGGPVKNVECLKPQNMMQAARLKSSDNQPEESKESQEELLYKILIMNGQGCANESILEKFTIIRTN